MRIIQRSEGSYNWNDAEDCELCKIRDSELDALYEGGIEDACDIEPQAKIPLSKLLGCLQSWADWRRGQCDFPDGLSDEEMRMLEAAHTLDTDYETANEKEGTCARG